LLAAGCEQAQGPFFAPVLTAAEATVLLGHAVIESHEVTNRVSSSSAA
jgi:hypothetical protein